MDLDEFYALECIFGDKIRMVDGGDGVQVTVESMDFVSCPLELNVFNESGRMILSKTLNFMPPADIIVTVSSSSYSARFGPPYSLLLKIPSTPSVPSSLFDAIDRMKNVLNDTFAGKSKYNVDTRDVDADNLLLLTKYDAMHEAERTFECSICYSTHPYSERYRLACGHTYCTPCLREYISTLVTESSSARIMCPERDCRKEINMYEVKEIVSSNVLERLDNGLLEVALSSMSDVVRCPRRGCNCPVICDVQQHMARCDKCGHCFCTRCWKAYHALSPCEVSIKNFENLDVNELKEMLKSKYGEVMATSIIDEISISRTYKRCPRCAVPTYKFEGNLTSYFALFMQ